MHCHQKNSLSLPPLYITRFGGYYPLSRRHDVTTNHDEEKPKEDEKSAEALLAEAAKLIQDPLVEEIVVKTDINPKTGNIVVILRVVLSLFFVEKRLEKKGKKGWRKKH